MAKVLFVPFSFFLSLFAFFFLFFLLPATDTDDFTAGIRQKLQFFTLLHCIVGAIHAHESPCNLTLLYCICIASHRITNTNRTVKFAPWATGDGSAFGRCD